jgi:hypothetical protein
VDRHAVSRGEGQSPLLVTELLDDTLRGEEPLRGTALAV